MEPANLVRNGFEFYWMKRIVERDTNAISLLDRVMGGYFFLANAVGDNTYFDVTRDSAAEHKAIWQAFLGGNRLPMRLYVESREFSEKFSTALNADIDDALFGA